MNKKKLFIGSIITVLGAGVGIALYTIKKSKKIGEIKTDEKYEREYTELKRQK